MLVSKVLVLLIALSMASARRYNFKVSPNLKSYYGWDEFIQICGTALTDMTQIICLGNSNYDETNLRLRRSKFVRKGISYDCCERLCTPRHILLNYCENQEIVNTGRDLEIRPTTKPPTTVAPISTETTTQTQYCTIQNWRGELVLWECEKDGNGKYKSIPIVN